MEISTKGFGSYDIRGIYPTDINEVLAYRIGRVYPRFLQKKSVVVGGDIRFSSPTLKDALIKGLMESGCDVMDVGLCGTEMIYFATAHWNLGGGIMVTASHNPKEYNGMKFVKEESRPISSKNGLREMAKAVESEEFPAETPVGNVKKCDILSEYVRHILSYIDVEKLNPFKVVANAGNGAAGLVIDEMERHLPFEFVKVFNEPNGHFPNGVPNPILQENREATSHAVQESRADVGIAWDGDFDRCFLFDEKGAFIEGYYMVGLLASAFLKKHKGAKIVCDARVMWNTMEITEELGGIPIISKSGHAFIKDKMREEDAVYGGEMSAHHYFRDFSYCDSGMIPWLLILEVMSQSNAKKLSELVRDRQERYPASGEINSTVEDAEFVLRKVEAMYGSKGEVSKIDGLSVAFPDWRFNLRKSSTEPLVRLNVESRQNRKLMEEKTAELLKVIRG